MESYNNKQINQKTQEQNLNFEKIEGYNLEVFSSEVDMYSRMESIRKSSLNEAHGFIVKEFSQFGFYYQMGDSPTSVELPNNINIDNSWHSHPDSNSEIVFNEENLPDDISENIIRIAKRIVMEYKEIDEISPRKISLMDLINILSYQRDSDLISLPNGKLLSLFYNHSEKDALCREFASKINQCWINLLTEIKPKLTEENTKELGLMMILQYYDYAISEFKNILSNLGYGKMTTENFIEILNKMGLSNNIRDVV